MPQTSLQDLRRIAESMAALKGHTVLATSMRSDFRQLKLELTDGVILVVAVENDDLGRPRLEVDVVRQPEEIHRHQLEVRFEAAG